MRRRGVLLVVFKTPGMHIPPWYWFRPPTDAGASVPGDPRRLDLVSETPTAGGRSRGGWCLDHAADGASRPPGAQHVGGVNAVVPSQRRGHQSQHLVSRVRPPRSISQVQVLLYQLGRPRCRARVDGRSSPALAIRRWSSKATWMRSGWRVVASCILTLARDNSSYVAVRSAADR